MGLLKKKLAAGAAVVALGGFLAACDNGGTDDAATDNGDNGDAVTAASITADPEEVVASLGADGNWITALTDDVTVDEAITVEGEFHYSGDDSNEVYRKLGLYDNDEDNNVNNRYTLSVPELIVESPNFHIHQGTLDGDVYVNAEGFSLEEATITGNVTFASEELQESANLDGGTVEGEVSVDE
ncbi:hypothetical protein GCM10008932_02420 [Alkalibacterium iburiense]|uniref:Lipoprotein n=1 Tax=Alkalibacterium iburiense TaxID=290589 RepID=A0ABP3GVQ6_9LACT